MHIAICTILIRCIAVRVLGEIRACTCMSCKSCTVHVCTCIDTPCTSQLTKKKIISYMLCFWLSNELNECLKSFARRRVFVCQTSQRFSCTINRFFHCHWRSHYVRITRLCYGVIMTAAVYPGQRPFIEIFPQ